MKVKKFSYLSGCRLPGDAGAGMFLLKEKKKFWNSRKKQVKAFRLAVRV